MYQAEDNQRTAEESGRLVVALAHEFERVDRMVERAERSPRSAAAALALTALYRRVRRAQLRRRLAVLPHDERAWIVRPLLEEPSPTARQVVRPLARQLDFSLKPRTEVAPAHAPAPRDEKRTARSKPPAPPVPAYPVERLRAGIRNVARRRRELWWRLPVVVLWSLLATLEAVGDWHDWRHLKNLVLVGTGMLFMGAEVITILSGRRKARRQLALLALDDREKVLQPLGSDPSPAVRRLAKLLRKDLEQAPELMPAAAPGGEGSEPAPADYRPATVDRIPEGRAPAPP